MPAFDPNSADRQDAAEPKRPKAWIAEDDHQAIERRLAEWRPGYLLRTPEEEFWFVQLVTNSVRLDQCHKADFDIHRLARERADHFWDVDRRDDAEDKGAMLSRSPGLYKCRLEGTKQGADWMIERWRMLGRVLDRKGAWNKRQLAQAFDLLGTDKIFRDSSRDLDQPAAVVAREIARLEAKKVGSLEKLDAMDRDSARMGLHLYTSKEWNKLQRFESACSRLFYQASDKLRSCRCTPRTEARPELKPNPEPKAPTSAQNQAPSAPSGRPPVVDAPPLARSPYGPVAPKPSPFPTRPGDPARPTPTPDVRPAPRADERGQTPPRPSDPGAPRRPDDKGR